MCVERVEQGTQDTALWGSYVQGDGVGGELADFRSMMAKTERLRRSFFPQAIRLLNSVS